MRKQVAVICDLDGTLCDIRHRFHHFHAGDMNKFEAGIELDRPNGTVFTTLYSLNFHLKLKVIFVTCRDESLREVTTSWIKNTCHEFSDSPIFMRNVRDYRSDASVKRDIYTTHIKDFYDVMLVLEDRDQCVKMWRDLGLECWQVANGDY